MPEARLASLPAADPGSPGFRSVQPESIFQRVVKPALRATVSLVCAGSIAIQSVTVSGYAQTQPAPQRYDQNNGTFDIPLVPLVCTNAYSPPPSQPPSPEIHNCPAGSPINANGASTSYGDQGAPVSFQPDPTVHPPTSGGPISTPASMGQVVQLHLNIVNSSATAFPNVPVPGWFPEGADFLDFQNQIQSAFVVTTLGIGAWAFLNLSGITLNGAQQQIATDHISKRIIGWFGVAGISYILAYIKVWAYWLTYAASRKLRDYNEVDGRTLAAYVSGVLTAVFAFGAGVLGKYVDNLAISGKFRRKLLATDPDAPKILGKISWALLYMVKHSYIAGGYMYLPALKGDYGLPAYPATRLLLPKSINDPNFPHHDGTTVSLRVEVFDKKQSKWVYKESVYINAEAESTIPVKFVNDGANRWMLSGIGSRGFHLFKQPQHTNLNTFGKNFSRWSYVKAQLIDFYPNKDYVYGVSSDQKLFSCKQSCDTGDWKQVSLPAHIRPVAVVTGPDWSIVTRSTRGMPNFIFVRDSTGKIYGRYEALPGGTWWDYSTWGPQGNYLRLPLRARQLLFERYPLGDWENRKRLEISLKNMGTGGTCPVDHC